MSKRRAPRFATEREAADETVEAADIAREHTIVDYLNGRLVWTVLLTVEALAILLLSPMCYRENLIGKMKAGDREKDYAAALAAVTRYNAVFSCDPTVKRSAIVQGVHRLLAITPEARLVYLGNAARYLAELKRYEESAELLTQLEAIDAKRVPTDIKGLVYCETGRREEGIKLLQQLARDAKRPRANFYVGRDLAEQGRHLEAGLLLARCLDDPRFSDEARKILGQIQETLKIHPVAPTRS